MSVNGQPSEYSDGNCIYIYAYCRPIMPSIRQPLSTWQRGIAHCSKPESPNVPRHYCGRIHTHWGWCPLGQNFAIVCHAAVGFSPVWDTWNDGADTHTVRHMYGCPWWRVAIPEWRWQTRAEDTRPLTSHYWCPRPAMYGRELAAADAIHLDTSTITSIWVAVGLARFILQRCRVNNNYNNNSRKLKAIWNPLPNRSANCQRFDR